MAGLFGGFGPRRGRSGEKLCFELFLAQPQRPSVSLDLHDEAANWDP